MATGNQKAEARPISFILHNLATGASPVELKLVIRPEDLSVPYQSRITANQTMGGVWLDDFGRGVPSVSLSGHTGWGAGARKNGFEAYKALHNLIFKEWHIQRASALRHGLDADDVKLIYADHLDDITWVMAPNTFLLKRNKSRPLLSQYQISLLWLSDDVSDTVEALDELNRSRSTNTNEMAAASLQVSLVKINEARASGMTASLGSAQREYDNLLTLTSTTLESVNTSLATGLSVMEATNRSVFDVATRLTKAVLNITNTLISTIAFPQIMMARFLRLASSLRNAYCLLSNVLSQQQTIPNYAGLYGSSNCSSTAGGSPVSIYDTANPFSAIQPNIQPASMISGAASNALSGAGGIDPVLNPITTDDASRLMGTVNSGVTPASNPSTGTSVSGATTKIPNIRIVEVQAWDNLRSIALRELGHSGRWTELVLLNKLKSPYIALQASSGVLAFGDNIKVPSPGSMISADSDPAYVYGTDALVTGGKLVIANGDLAPVSGEKNLLQAIKNHVTVSKKSLGFHPRYGCLVHDVLGVVSGPTAGQLSAFYVQSSILEDLRIDKVTSSTAEIAGDSIKVTAEIVPVAGRQIDFKVVI